MIKVSTTGMAVSLKTDLRFPVTGQQGHGHRIIQDIYTLLKESFKDILQELILDHIKIQQIFLSQVKLWKKWGFLVVRSLSGN